ncbi:nucleotide exchange factor GrpE [Paenibacillus thermoaerophilus]|uniref:Protein GrpE n=1 Tax=Paenibacillus thermoaerophilus TaxID=1215385 RepID=A0ABW2UXF2_9BACL|nr:nucleotide exchange factor GrpE [Paenibacillus thermoaerophilus]
MSTEEQRKTEEPETVEAVQEDVREGVAEEPEQQTDSGQTAQGEAQSETDPLQRELDQLRREFEENQQRYLRLQADYDNFRKRTRQEKEDFAKYASQKLMEQLLPVIDNFERAMAAASASGGDYESLAKGVEMIYRQLRQVLEQEGLTPLQTVGQPFDPELHQAVMQVESEEYGEGIVVEEVQKGYRLKDKVIRPAMVKVSM